MRSLKFWLIGLAVLGLGVALGGWWAYENNSSVRFRVQMWYGQVRDVVAPHPDVVPTALVMAAPPTFAFPSPTGTPFPTGTSTPAATALTPEPTPTATLVLPPPSPSPTPPAKFILTGLKHEYQLFNNCGPASLAMDLSFWGWQGSQKDTAKILKPNQDDKNVSPREMYEYLTTIGYDAYIRVGGDVDTLKRFIAAGYPVIVEKGFLCTNTERCLDWFGHYSVFSGYDDAQKVFITQDSFRGPDIKIPYDELVPNWRVFNYLYIVPFPASPEHDARVLELLGPAADLTDNYTAALLRAQTEAIKLAGQDGAFAWFNVGTNLAYLQDYGGAAAAYDQARRIGLPYRMFWYQFGAYRSYYQMARYQDVVDIATFSINVANIPAIEEAFYWRGQAEESLGQRDAAIADYREALVWHPGDEEATAALVALGEVP